jgi:hypothetical protein
MNEEKIKRYNVESVDMPYCGITTNYEESLDGEWCLYEEIESELTRLREENEKMRNYMRELPWYKCTTLKTYHELQDFLSSLKGETTQNN